VTRAEPPTPDRGNPIEVFGVFLKLGLTSFGGPIAHLGYFRDELVTRRAWLSDKAYGDLVSLCQFLPGPASSQVGFALGLMRAGWAGALAAFLAFTLPSALVLLAFAQGAAMLGGPMGAGLIDGLKIVAVAIVAQAVLGMARSFCAERAHATIAVAAVAVLAVVPGAGGMIAAIIMGAAAGFWLRGSGAPEAADSALVVPVSARVGIAALAGFAALLILLPVLAAFGQAWAVVDAFFRAGALVFGGGHVVLPLLEAEVVQRGWVSEAQFLAGYGAAQAVPGPLFTFAAYLGAVLAPVPNGLAGAALALGAVFLPGFLLLVGVLPFWSRFRTLRAAQSLMRGANAAVVGVLGFALYHPVFTTAIGDAPAFALGLACFALLTVWRVPPWAVVVTGALGGVVLAVTL
jgi:chromate transporter